MRPIHMAPNPWELRLPNVDHENRIFTEAMFIGGKELLAPFEKMVSELRDELTATINQSNSGKPFDLVEFSKKLIWKRMEDFFTETFGFRKVALYPIGVYDYDKNEFEGSNLRVYTYTSWRFPIDGIVTEKGFYDSTHSLDCTIAFAMKTLQTYSDGEIVAMLLHELGHNIDPAIVSINYAKTNAISKYLTNREDEITPIEAKAVKDDGFFGSILSILKKTPILGKIIRAIGDFFTNTESQKLEILAKVRELLRHSTDFDISNSKEAFADNFARMYGYGVELASAFVKREENFANVGIFKWDKSEKTRQRVIGEIITLELGDEHRTTVQRIYSVIKEYERDIADETIPIEVRDALRSDINEIRLLLERMINTKSDLLNRLNKAIIDDLTAKSNVQLLPTEPIGGEAEANNVESIA